MSAESNARTHAEQFTWWQGTPDMNQQIAELSDLAALRDAVNDLITERATAAHDRGQSWTAVGEALGITRQAAQKRFSATSRLF